MTLKISFFSPFNIPYSAYGLRIIYNALKENGIPSKVYYYPSDFRELYNEETLELISKQLRDSDIIGISLYTNHFTNVVLLTNYLRKTGSNALIVWGGIHAMIRPEECIQYAHIVCVGEAEECFPELCKRIIAGHAYTDVKGFWYNDKETGIIKNAPLITNDLNKVPFALYSEDHLLIKKDGLVPLIQTNISSYTTLASRGCPFSCTYCINGFFHKDGHNVIRYRTIDNLISELKTVKSQHETIKYFLIDDDAFFSMNLKYIKEFSEQYKNEIGIPLYISGITPTTISAEKLKYLVYAGLDSIRIGFQTGSERILRMYKRNYTSDQMLKAMDIATSFNLTVQLDIITDNPWETEEDTLKTITLLDKAKKRFFLNIFNLVFFPGTELYEKAKIDGLIHDETTEIYQMRYHTYRKNPLNITLELLSIRANYYLRLPFVIKTMLKNNLYNNLIYLEIVKFYIKINNINIPYYLMVRFFKTWKRQGIYGLKIMWTRLMERILGCAH